MGPLQPVTVPVSDNDRPGFHTVTLDRRIAGQSFTTAILSYSWL